MSIVFADTSYFVALLNPHDVAHTRASALTTTRPTSLYTTAWVVTEFANFMSRPGDRLRFVRTLATLKADPRVVIIPPSPEMLEKGLDYFARRHDKAWSLTDCISFLVMAEHGITDAWTADHHFEQAGFTALLK